MKSVKVQLFVISLLALFCELMVIRWLATEIRIFAYFKNLPLMSAFLGLGLGFIYSKSKRDLFPSTGILLLYLCGLLAMASFLGLTHLSFANFKDVIFLGYFAKEGQVWFLSLALMLLIFALSTTVFVGFGQQMGKLFAELRPLQAYSINVAGSLAGSVLFSVLSLLETPPGVWLVATSLLFFLTGRKIAYAMLGALGIVYLAYLAPFFANRYFVSSQGEKVFVETKWSPYYRIDTLSRSLTDTKGEKIPFGYDFSVNYDSFQSIIDCTPEKLAKLAPAVQQELLQFYGLPYNFLKNKHPRVLVLGSGTGNDVACALRNGAEHVDAIEIDPALWQLGIKLHPEHPYDSPKVNVYIMDARTFLRTTKEKYDLVVFATLDSHAAFSSLSSLRLDNYIFTENAFRDARKLVNDDGFLAVSFVVVHDWLWDRYGKALTTATGFKPTGFLHEGALKWGYLFAGPGVMSTADVTVPPEFKPHPVDENAAVEVATDSWPFVFLPRKEVPFEYVFPVLIVLAASAIPVARAFSKGVREPLNWQMFGLGMAFMLLEVRAITDLALLFGSTWIVNSVIISGVMVVILAANFLASRISSKYVPWLGVALLASLGASTFLDVGELSGMGMVIGGAVGTTIYLFPLVFASTMFALLFKSTGEDSSTALAFNLIGGVIGVCLEYLSMALGVRALGWIAFGIYASVLAIHSWASKRSLPTTGEAPDPVAS